MQTISGSRVAAMLGASKFQSRLALFHELRGDAPPTEDSELLEEGREFQVTIAGIASRKFGLRLVSGPDELRHGDLSGHPDAYAADDSGHLAVVEIKHTLYADTGDEWGWGQPGTDEVPKQYAYQAMVYGHLLLKVTGGGTETYQGFGGVGLAPTKVADYVYLAARLRSGVQLYKIPVDPQVIAKIEMEASAFLDRVARGEPPDPETPEEFRLRWVGNGEKVVQADHVLLARLQKLHEVRKGKAALEAEEEELKAAIYASVQDAGVVEFERQQVATLKSDRQFDSEGFLRDHPDVAGKYMKLDATALGKKERRLKDAYMVIPSAADHKRVIRISDKALEALAK